MTDHKNLADRFATALSGDSEPVSRRFGHANTSLIRLGHLSYFFKSDSSTGQAAFRSTSMLCVTGKRRLADK